MTAVHFETAAEARSGLKALLDAAVEGRTATVRRAHDVAAVVDAARLRDALERVVTSEPVVVHEEGEWAAFLPGLPISAGGATIDEAIDDLVVAMREYAEDWHSRLRLAPNHRDAWGFVQLVDLSTDEQLRAWLTRSAA